MLFTNNRLTMRLGHYLGHNNHNVLDEPEPILDISGCYALLGESDHAEHNAELPFSEDLPQTLNRVITRYEKQSGTWLEPEQVALAAIQYEAQQQAALIRHQLATQLHQESKLHCTSKTSYLRLALLAQALNLKHISTEHPTPATTNPPCCRRSLNVLLDDISMSEIEAIGRELREHCTAELTQTGSNPKALQTCWHLIMRYTNSEARLRLKCMPIEMMRDVFEAQHKTQFGFALQDEPILIDALEIDVSVRSPCLPDMPNENPYIEQIMAQWKADPSEKNSWLRVSSGKATSAARPNFLSCPILKEILADHIKAPDESSVSIFLIKKLKKEVDVSAVHN
ncbi:MAG: hypothetical protein CSB47_02590 [Proteobacteria bacterium]|nr:MAG: hypothetical protein CSB47_02590 [Pseudomonadota bacterium]